MPFLKNHVAQGQGTEKLQSCGNNLHFESEYQLTNGDFLETRGKNTRSLSDEILSGAESDQLFSRERKKGRKFSPIKSLAPFPAQDANASETFSIFPSGVKPT